MTIYRDFSEIKGSYTACIGFFDGVHKGHRFLLEHLQKEARLTNTLSAVISFANHPRKLIQPDFQLHLINTLEEKIANLSSTGIDACFLLDFTEDIRNLSAREFICDFLSAKMHVTKLLIGYDHRFGRDRAEGFEDYVRYGKSCGMEVVQEPVFNDGTDRNYSSSEVRRNLISGNIAEATSILGQYYRLEGVVIHGHQLGRKLGFPTANLNPFEKDKIIPSNGVYAAKVQLENGDSFPSMVNIGFRPTVDSEMNRLSVEAHLIGFEGDLYDQSITISFIERIRDERKMSSIEELKKQLSLDCKTSLQIIEKADR